MLRCCLNSRTTLRFFASALPSTDDHRFYCRQDSVACVVTVLLQVRRRQGTQRRVLEEERGGCGGRQEKGIFARFLKLSFGFIRCSARRRKLEKRGCRKRYSKPNITADFFLSFIQLRRAGEIGGANAERDNEIRRALSDERLVFHSG